MIKSVKLDHASLYKGVGKLLKSKDLGTKMKQIADEKKQDWETETKVMPTRVIAAIYSEDEKQIREELDSHRIVGGLR